MNHKDVVALVTGGASGLGEAGILELVKKGAKVVVIDVDADKGEKLAANIGANAIFVKTDVTSKTDVRQTIQKAVDAFGTINVVVNCAGVVNPGKLIGRKGPLPLDAFNKVLQINTAVA
ncbi:MAG TPA: SDR family oxidoreductase [Smithella sp.]|nr:SDR family oxidoreductase [Smithella sp.]